MIFAREPLTAALIEEARPLLEAHWVEIAAFKDIPLDVDDSAYLAAEDAGLVRCFTARRPVVIPQNNLKWFTEGEIAVPARSYAQINELVGYAVFFVREHLHYRGSLQATQDVLYLHPSVRGGAGARFIAWCDEQLAADGVQVVYHHAKLAHPQLGKVLERLGYEPAETIYAKRLDEPAELYTRYDADDLTEHAQTVRSLIEAGR